jgi:arylsulfatase A-like enzyme
MKSSFVVLSLFLAFAFQCSFVVAAETASKTNIVYIMADDLGWTDLGCQGSTYYETPNIDLLAKQGTRFLQYHNCQNCQPTRAALMTGQYAARTGVYTVGGIDRFDWSSRSLRPVDNASKLPLDKVTVAQSLKANGYATGMFGKWHLGEDGDYHPSKRGFDEAIVSAGVHFNFKTSPPVEYPKGQYLADFLTDKAVDFLQRHRNDPFFLYLPHFGVHSPHQAKPNWIEHFKSKQGVGGHNNPTYAAMIASVDESVGRIMKTLDELKLTEKTLVVFTSDNGGVGGYVREGVKEAGDVTDNTPLRSGKGSLYEGGTRVPFIARWPGVVKPGTTCDTPAIHVDIHPTLLDVAGGKKISDQPFDGESLLPLLRDSQARLTREAIYQHFPGYLGAGKDSWRTTPVGLIQIGDWKLMNFLEDNRFELYNLREDIGESNNLVTKSPEKFEELKSKMMGWRSAIKAPMPTVNTPKAGASTEKKEKTKEKTKGKKNKKKSAAA